MGLLAFPWIILGSMILIDKYLRYVMEVMTRLAYGVR